jgi:virginiamycin B lyase
VTTPASAFGRTITALTLCAALPACGGGSSSAGGANALPASGSAGVRVSLTIPAATPALATQSRRRTPAYVSASTKSISFAVNGGAPANFNVTAGSPGCQADLTKPSFSELAVNLEPRGITVGPDGALWFVEDAGRSVGRYQTAAGYVDRFTGVNQNAIVTGTDGALWIADVFSDTIGHMTTGGAYSQFAGMPTDVNQMAVTSEGSVWYTPFTSGPLNALYHVSSAGTFLPGDTITTSGTTHVPTVGPDGAVWFTESTPTNSWIGRVALANGTWSLTNEFPVTASLGAGTEPSFILAGPDGALWIDDSANMMDRFTLDGTVTNRYPITVGYGAIATGTDGALWFTEQAAPPAGKIGRLTTSGALTEFSPPSGYPQGITVGADGTIWFTENSYSPYTIHNLGSLAFPTNCALSAPLPPGASSLVVTTYDSLGGAGGGGSALSTQTIPVTISGGRTNALNLVLNGIVNGVAPAVAGQNPPQCSATCAVPILLEATDADGRVIVGPGSYVDANGNALTITLSVTGSGTLSTTTFTAPPATPPTLNYSGCFNGATITPTVSGGSLNGAAVPLVLADGCT